jgi:hypothetical protein
MRPKSAWGHLALLGVVALMVLPGAMVGAESAAQVVGNFHLNLSTVSKPLWAQTGQYLSYNWAGYATFDQGNGTVSRVSGTWIEPAVTCPARGQRYAVFWVGIDGFTSPTVEQDGTLAYCSAGVASYYAWWELYPTNDIQIIPTMTVSPGDHMSGSVFFHAMANDFTMSLTDRTTGTTFSITAAQASQYQAYALENSAECIIERPGLVSNSGNFSLAHLADFGTVTFQTCMATVSGTFGNIGSFAPYAIIYMIGLASTVSHITYLASPGSPWGLLKWAFTTTWQKGS